MHGEKRGERYFNMHRLQGQNWRNSFLTACGSGCWAMNYFPCIERRRILGEVHKPVKQEKVFW